MNFKNMNKECAIYAMNLKKEISKNLNLDEHYLNITYRFEDDGRDIIERIWINLINGNELLKFEVNSITIEENFDKLIEFFKEILIQKDNHNVEDLEVVYYEITSKYKNLFYVKLRDYQHVK